MIRRGRWPAITRHATPSGSVIAGPWYGPRRPDENRAREIGEQFVHDGPGRRLPSRLVAPRQLPEDDRARAGQQPGLAKLGDHSIQAVRTLADFIEEQDVSLGRR